jgi:hypothetical protein
LALPETKDIEIQGNLGGDVYAMQIDEDSLSHLMTVLSDIYSNVKSAIVREYATNALDSHTDAGQTQPIEIWTPTTLSPNLVIKDYGLGLSREDIDKVYRKYGASTKRKSNTTTGRIGIGAKSALAYTNSFHLTAVKDGKKIVAVISHTGTGGSVEIVSEVEATEPNGVSVSIPVNNISDRMEIVRYAKDFQKYAKEGSVLLDGRLSETKIEKISDRFGIMERTSYYDNDVVVMGNVAYPITDYAYNQALNEKKVVYYVDIGEVSFTPSREELQYNAKTKDALVKYRKELYDTLIPKLQAEVDTCTSFHDAIVKAQKLTSMNFRNTDECVFTYQGHKIPANPHQGFDMKRVRWNVDRYGSHGTGTKTDRNFYFTQPQAGYLYIKGFTPKAFSRRYVLKIEEYLKSQNIDYDQERAILLYSHDEDMLKWFDKSIFVNWSDIADVKVTLPVTGKKGERKWEGRGGGQPFGKHVPDVTKDIYYISKTDLSGRFFDPSDLNKFVDDNTQVFLVTDSQADQFTKKYPTAQPLRRWWAKKAQTILDSITPEERKAVEYSGISPEVRHGLAVDDILDKELKEALGIPNKTLIKSGEDKVWQARTAANKSGMSGAERDKFIDSIPTKKDVADFEQRYPLMFASANTYWRGHTYEINKHVVEYVNMVYKKEKGIV